MGFGDRKDNQLGFQTGERSDEYVKNTAYSVDGKALRQEQVYANSMLLSQSFEYDWDGFVKSRKIELKDVNGPSAFSYELGQTRDSLGRLKHLYLAQKLLLTFEYDDLGRVSRVIDSSGRETSLRYDHLTKGVKGWDSVIGQQRIDYEWHYDERGLVASESFVSNEKAVAKAYSYDDAEFLTNEVSQLDTRAYAYDYDLRQEKHDLPLDDFGYRLSAKGLSLNYGPDGHLESSVGPAGLFRYIHDAKGQRIARFKNSNIDMIFADDLIIRSGKIFQILKVQGIFLGIIEQGQFRPVYTDSRGTPFFADREGLKVAGAYGETKLEVDQDILNYAGFGKDNELGWVRFGVRDYAPVSGSFTSPDSLFFENPELCVESPVECNLYSYAKNNPLKYVDSTGNESEDAFADRFDQLVLAGRESEAKSMVGGRAELTAYILGTLEDLKPLPELLTLGGIGPPREAVQSVAGLFRGSVSSSAEVLASKSTTVLYRAVGPQELSSIQSSARFSNPYGIEGKYFSTTEQGARSYARMAESSFGDPPYTIVKSHIPTSAIQPFMKAEVDKGINAVVVPTEILSKMSPPEVLP